MEIFYNRIDPNYKQVVRLGPKWLTEYREMDANFQYAGWTLDLMAYFLEMLIHNEFPQTCDEATLRIFERILNIEYDSEMTLEERRRVVATYWAGNGHMSKSTIAGLVSMYTGQHADVRWNGETLIIDFDNTATVAVAISMLQRILRRRMPAHIDYNLRCVCTAHVGILPRRQPNRHVFMQTGTYPKTNVGLSLAKEDLEIRTQANKYREHFPQPGDDPSGQFPKTNIGLVLNKEILDVSPNPDAVPVPFQNPGESSGEAGQFPKPSIGVKINEDGVLLQPGTSKTKVLFDDAGQVPGTSTGLALSRERIAVETEVEAVRSPISQAGTSPEMNIQAKLSGDVMSPGVESESWKTVFVFCGDETLEI